MIGTVKKNLRGTPLYLLLFTSSLLASPSLDLKDLKDLKPLIPLSNSSTLKPRLMAIDGLLEKDIEAIEKDLTLLKNEDKRTQKALLKGIEDRSKEELLDLALSVKNIMQSYWHHGMKAKAIENAQKLHKITFSLFENLEKKEKAKNLYLKLTSEVFLGYDTTNTMTGLIPIQTRLSESDHQGFKVLYNAKLLGSKFTYKEGQKALLKLKEKAPSQRKLLILTYLATSQSREDKKFAKELFKKMLFLSFRDQKLVKKEAIDIALNYFTKYESFNNYAILPISAIKEEMPESYYGMSERVLLSQKVTAISLIPFYQKAVKVFAAGGVLSKIELRLAKLYEKSPFITEYASFLAKKVKKYHKKGQKSGLSESLRGDMHSHFAQETVTLALRVISDAKWEKKALDFKIPLLQAALRFNKDPKKERLLADRLASMLASKGQYAKSSETYFSLSNDHPGGENYLKKSFLLQAKISQWPANPPWFGITKGFIKERKKLSIIAGKLAARYPKSLLYQGHRAMLESFLGDKKRAINILLKALLTSKKSPMTHKALTAAMNLAIEENSHDHIITIAKMAKKFPYKALYGGPNQFFAQHEAGAYVKKAFSLCQQQKWRGGLDAYDRYFSLNSGSQNRLGRILLGAIRCGYKGKVMAKTVSLALRHLTAFKKSPHRHEVTKIAMEFARKLQQPRHVMTIIRASLKGYLTIEQRYELSLTLAKAHQKAIEYPEERQVYLSIVQDARFTDSQRTHAALQAIEVDRVRHKSYKNISVALGFLKSLKNMGAFLQKRVLLYEVHYALAHRHFGELRRLRARLLDYGRRDGQLKFALGSIEFLLAEKASLLAMSQIAKKAPSPARRIMSYKKAMQTIHKAHMAVCQKNNAFCLQANERIRYHAQNLKDKLTGMSFPPHLSHSSLAAHKLYQSDVLAYLDNIRSKSSKAARRAARGAARAARAVDN